MGWKTENRRYLLVEIRGEIPEARALNKEIRKNVSYLAGEIALAKTSLHIILISKEIAIGRYLVRCNQEYRDLITSALLLISIPGSSIDILKTFGTIASANRYLAKSNQDPVFDNEEYAGNN